MVYLKQLRFHYDNTEANISADNNFDDCDDNNGANDKNTDDNDNYTDDNAADDNDNNYNYKPIKITPTAMT